MAEVKVLRVTKVPSLDPQRIGKTDVLVLYALNDGPPQYERLAEEGFTEAALVAKIRASRDFAGSLEGKTLKL